MCLKCDYISEFSIILFPISILRNRHLLSVRFGRCYLAVGGYEIMVGLIVKRSPSSLSFGNVFSATHSFATGKLGCQFVQSIHPDGAAVAVRHLLFNFT